MKTKEEIVYNLHLLGLWFDDLNQMIQDVFIALKNLETIKEHETDTKFLNEDFFLFYRHQQYFIINVQLTKFFQGSKNQKRNIIALCNQFYKKEYEEELNYIIEESNERGFPHFKNYDEVIEKIKIIRQKIKNHQNIIDDMIIVRNKIYAHTDYPRKVNYANLVDIRALAELAAFCYNNTRGFIYGVHTDFSKGVIDLTLKDIIRIMKRGIDYKEINLNKYR